MSDSVRPHRWQPTRLSHPWDSPGKNTGVGCHFLLQCMKVKSESEVAQSCPTPRDPMDYSLPGSSVHGIFQARVLEWGATPSFSLSLFCFSHTGLLARCSSKGLAHFYPRAFAHSSADNSIPGVHVASSSPPSNLSSASSGGPMLRSRH